MYTLSPNFHISNFRNRVVTCLLFTILSFSFLPSVSLAQQPTATIKTLNGDVLVSRQTATVGAVLQAGDTIQTQAGSSAVLELSDGSELHLSENTQITVADLAQTSTGARVSLVKLMWGQIRAFLSPQHQIEGSSFDIETPNALIGVKFSEPDIEVSYNLEKAETVGIAYTVELLAKNLVTGETMIVPVGSTVFITAVGIKVIAGIVGVVGSSGAGSTGTGTVSTTASTGSAGMGTGTKVAIGVGAAAAVGGVAAIAASSGNSGGTETAESIGDLSGAWDFNGSCVAQGCTDDIFSGNPSCNGIRMCDCCEVQPCRIYVSQSGNILSGEHSPGVTPLNGVVDGSSVSFTIDTCFIPISGITTFTGVIDGNTIRGNFFGRGSDYDFVTWSGTFIVTIKKE